jgi:hypothetical protein
MIDAMNKRVYTSCMGDNQKEKKRCGTCLNFLKCYGSWKLQAAFDKKDMPGCVNWKSSDSGNGKNQ